jgi:hypothetical protein
MGLENIKVGDKVWVSSSFGGGEKGEIRTVVRLTPSQIILDGIEKYSRYQRGKKSRYGDDLNYYAIGHRGGRITLYATAAECEKWEAQKTRKLAEAEEYKERRQKAEAKRDELSALFPASQEANRGIYVTDADVSSGTTEQTGL